MGHVMKLGDWLYRVLAGILAKVGKPPETQGEGTKKVLDEVEYIKKQAKNNQGDQ